MLPLVICSWIHTRKAFTGNLLLIWVEGGARLWGAGEHEHPLTRGHWGGLTGSGGCSCWNIPSSLSTAWNQRKLSPWALQTLSPTSAAAQVFPINTFLVYLDGLYRVMTSYRNSSLAWGWHTSSPAVSPYGGKIPVVLMLYVILSRLCTPRGIMLS